MNTTEAPSLLKSAAIVSRGVAATATALLALATFAYLIGWRENSAYFTAIGASWYAPVLGPTRHLQTASWIATTTLLFAFNSVHALAMSTASVHGLRRAAITTLAVAFVIFMIGLIEPASLSESARSALLMLGAISLAISNGLTLGEVVGRFNADLQQRNAYLLYLLAFTAVITFAIAPDRMGKARAQDHMSATSSYLPHVELDPSDPRVGWRLVDAADGKALIVAIAADKASPNRFRIVDITSIKGISSTTAPLKRPP